MTGVTVVMGYGAHAIAAGMCVALAAVIVLSVGSLNGAASSGCGPLRTTAPAPRSSS